MKEKEIQEKYLTLLHRQNGRNYLRYTSLILLMGIFIFSVVSFWFYGFIFLPVIIGSLFGIFCVRFPRLRVYKDHFTIEQIGLLSKFSDSFKFIEVKNVEFSEGFTDWNYLIVLALFGSGGYGGNNKADQMIISTIDNKIKIFNRFGSQRDFIRSIDVIRNQIHTQDGTISNLD